jgi:hypothetical protein
MYVCQRSEAFGGEQKYEQKYDQCVDSLLDDLAQ